LLLGGGANDSQVFTDSSMTNKAVTTYGQTKYSTVIQKFSESTILFDGSGDYLVIDNSADFDFGTGDFTLEWHEYQTGVTGTVRGRFHLATQILGGTGGNVYGLAVFTDSGGWKVTRNNATVSLGGSAVLSQWRHIALVRLGNVIKLFINGVQLGTDIAQTAAVPGTTNKILTLGCHYVGDYSFSGNMTGFKVTKGLARYTTTFTPPVDKFATNPPRLIGTVKDDTGTLCARTVRAYRRSNGVLVGSVASDAVTGGYTINTTTDDAHTIIALDDDAGTQYNALVLDKVIPA